MAQAIPYLAFDGTCAEAMRFYADTLGARLVMMLGGAETPLAEKIPPEHAHRILHAHILFDDGSLLYAGDAPAGMPFDGMKGITLTMNDPIVAEAEQVFAARRGRAPRDAIAPMFYAKMAGMLTDRFGTSWAINGEVTM